MIPYKTFAVVGGDLRQAHIANRLAQRGKTVYAMLLEENATLSPALQCSNISWLRECDAVILPMPLSSDDVNIHAPFSKQKIAVEEIFTKVNKKAVLFAGRVSKSMCQMANTYELNIRDYLEREELAVENAGITAEGALALAINELPISLIGANVLVTGYGRISKALLQRLCAMGAHVSAVARKYGDMAEIRTRGCEAWNITELEQAACHADVIFNTIPTPVFTEEVLKAIKKDTLLIDLASKPGGVAFEVAGELGVRTIWALSIPGKCAPISAGDIILKTIENWLTEEEMS